MVMIQDKRYKYIWKSDGNEEIYDIPNGKEEIQEIVIKKESKDRLRSELFKRKKSIGDVEERMDYNINDEIAKNLEALGYM